MDRTNNKETILVVEDDDGIRVVLEDLLEFEGYDVVSAKNGKEGLVILLKEHFSLIVCDVNMPGVSGFDMLKALKEKLDDDIIPPFIFLTARTTIEDIRIGMNLGANDYLLKPFNPIELLETIKRKIGDRKKIQAKAAALEQLRISQELHDNIQQLLVAANMGLEAIQPNIEKLDVETQNIYKRSRAYLKEATAVIRKLSRQLFDDLEINLEKKVNSLLLQIKESKAIETNFVYQVKEDLDNNFKTELFRIIQEVSTNIVKHAKAKKLEVLIANNSQSGRLVIKDDGIGIDPKNLPNNGGMGIENAKKRAINLNASFNLSSLPEHGTTITMVW